MQPLPFTNLGAQVAFFTVLGIFALAEVRIRVRSQLNRSGSPTERVSLLIVAATIYAGLVGAFFVAKRLRWAAITAGRWPIFVVGLVLMISGIVIRQWAVALLGRYFTVDVRVHPDQRVVDSGPYRWVAHPAYTAIIMTFVGIGLALGNWAALVVLAVLPSAGLIIRIHFEERALSDGLGEPYRRFVASRRHLLPGVW